MLRKVLLFLLFIVLVSGTWFWHERNHLALTASASPWQPAVGSAPSLAPSPRAPCADHDPLRKAYFGDLHVHTRFSMDARSRDMLGTVGDAYRFARGETIGLGPFDAEAVGQRRVRLERPLDFAAVTDHAEWIGEIFLCTTPGSQAYDSQACRAYRGEGPPVRSLGSLLNGPMRMLNVIGSFDRAEAVCGPENFWCREALQWAWEDTQAAAERYYDRSSDCRFTTFVGYEYSNSPGRAKVHRNVIFRNEHVPELPVSSLEQGDVLGLWESLDRLCNDADGHCEAIAIPHNPNVSNGRLFRIPWDGEPLAEQQRQARLRARLEPLVEMMQVKGESECRNGLWQVSGEDELCDFEKIRQFAEPPPADCEDDYSKGAVFGRGCQSRLDFARYALIEGMVQEARLGVNPYRFGMVGSTDTHNASPGDVDEDSYDGCCANTDTTPAQRLDTAADFAGAPAAARNPGGLMGVWAEENSRDALFDAMQRREAFATSGPRISPRLFVGARLPESLCDGDFARDGYALGQPMGSVLPDDLAESPVFAASVVGDPDGGLLQRLQVVKVWFDDDGQYHQSITDVAGDPDNGAGVDLASCQPVGTGARQLCATWRDPAFDPQQAAAWYLRAVENPSCRWSWRQCLAIPERERPAACTDPAIPKVIQERAWSSPVWFTPSGQAG